MRPGRANLALRGDSILQPLSARILAGGSPLEDGGE